MLDPVGPLPASVYWRRRAVAVGVVVLTLIALVWAGSVLVLPGASDEPTDTTAQSTPDTRAALPPNAVPASPAPGTAAPPLPAVDSGAPPGTTGASPGPATPSAGPGDETVRQDDTPRPSVPVAAEVPSPPTGPVPCTDGMIDVRAETGSPTYPAAARPELRLVVTNSSEQPCVRDLDGAEQEIAVWSGDGKTKLWSSNDCTNPATDDLRTLVPGQPVAFAVTWSGLASGPNCRAARDRVPAGAYRVLARLGGIVSDPVPLLLG